MIPERLDQFPLNIFCMIAYSDGFGHSPECPGVLVPPGNLFLYLSAGAKIHIAFEGEIVF